LEAAYYLHHGYICLFLLPLGIIALSAMPILRTGSSHKHDIIFAYGHRKQSPDGEESPDTYAHYCAWIQERITNGFGSMLGLACNTLSTDTRTPHLVRDHPHCCTLLSFVSSPAEGQYLIIRLETLLARLTGLVILTQCCKPGSPVAAARQTTIIKRAQADQSHRLPRRRN
jgi:hypothetical protein